MPLFLERYILPGDIPPEDIVYAMRNMNRRTNVRVLRCAYNLSEGRAWCVSEAPTEDNLRRGAATIEFPFTLDEVKPVESATVLNELAPADRIFDPAQTSPADVGASADAAQRHPSRGQS